VLKKLEKISRCDRVRNEVVLYTVKGDRNNLLIINRRTKILDWSILRRGCFLKHNFEGKFQFR